jgi:cell wall-associated NlpC family hydrolase
MTVLDLLEKQKAQSLGVFGAFVGKSNFSELDAKEDLVMITVEDIVDQIEQVVRTDVVNQIIAYNFGPKRIDEVEFEIDRNSLGRSKMIKEILKSAMQIQSSYAALGYFADAMPDTKAMCADLGIPVRSQLDQFEERSPSLIEREKQQQVEKQTQAQAKQAAQSQAQRNEASNDPDKRPTEKRDRTRDAKDKDITEGE